MTFAEKFFKTQNSGVLFYRFILFAFSFITTVFCFIKTDIPLLPLAFFVLFYIFVIFNNLKLNFFGKIIVVIAFIRFCYVPTLYGTTENFHAYSWYVPSFVTNQIQTQFIMILELFSIFITLFIYFKKHPYCYQEKRFKADDGYHFTFLAVGLISIVIIFIYPNVLPVFNFQGKTPSNAVFSIFHVSYACLFLFFANFINKKVKGKFLRWTLLITAFLIFVIPECIQGKSISRNMLIINAVAFFLLATRLLPKYKKKIYLVFAIFAILGFSFLTAIKMFAGYPSGTTPLIGTISIYTNYSYCDAYFAGPTHVNIGLDLIDSGVSGISYLFKDLFANVPFLSKYFFDGNTVYLFNEFVFRGVAQQEITPLVVQSSIYFGKYLCWVLPALFTYLSVKLFDYAYKKKCSVFSFYPLLCIGFVFTMSQIISLNAISMLIFIKFLPILIVYIVDIVAIKIYQKIKHKNKDIVENTEDENAIQIVNNKKTITVNYIFSLIHQLVIFVIPLITTPYISRVLLSDGLGKYDFANSLALYFVMFAGFGFGYYAQREIAVNKNDLKEKSKSFFEIMICKAITTGIALVSYSALIIFGGFAEYQNLLIILSLTVLASFFDITFFFKGTEDFKTVSLIQSLIKIISTVFLFVFVKTSNDIWIYALILSLNTLLSSLALFPFLRKQLINIKMKDLNVKRHFLPSFILFLPTIFGIFYTTFLKTMIGLLVPGTTQVLKDGILTTVSISDVENGYFSQADKLVQMGLALITSLGAVMASRNSTLFSSGKINLLKKNITNVLKYTLLISIPICIGLISISDNLVPWFFGDDFAKVSTLLKFYPALVIISGLGNLFGLQTLVSIGSFKKFTISTAIGAIVGVALGIPLIRYYGSIGAAITSLVSELFVLISMIIFSRKYIIVKGHLLNIGKYLLAGGLMGFFVVFLSFSLPASFVSTLLLCLIGAMIYFLVLILSKEDLTYPIWLKVKGFFEKYFI